MKKNVSILGMPMWLGQTKFGTNLGPSTMRTAGLADRLRQLALTVEDEGNVQVGFAGQFKTMGESSKNVKTIAKSSERLAARVSNILERESFPLVLGGDHSIAIGTIAGVASRVRNLGVIWFDAHADMNTPETSPSGNVHGMPLAASMGLGNRELVNVGGFKNKVKAENIVLIGARDIDPGEAELIARKNIKVYYPADVERLGIARVIAESLAYLTERCDGIHLSFDVDGIDPQEIPGVGTPVAGGISYFESLQAVQLLGNCDKLVSAEFVEVNPLLEQGDATARLTVDLIAAFCGERIRPRLAKPVREQQSAIS